MEKTQKDEVGLQVRSLRKAARYSQEALAHEMRERGESSWRQTTVAKVEAGNRPILLVEAVALADILGCQLADFFKPPEALKYQRPASVPNRLTISISEAGELLGIGRNQAYAAAREGQIPTLRLGRRLLVPTQRLLSLLDNGVVDHATPTEL